MRFLKFVEPNFICTVIDPADNVIEKWLAVAPTEAELKVMLASRLLKATTIEAYEFKDWRQRAKDEAKLAIKAKNKGYEYKQKLWTEIKQFLFLLSNNRCGYCETKVRIGFSGHVEHFRPKKKVDEDPKHPGYYWLAYEVENYIPCCENCNSARGKRNHFPLAKGSPRAKIAGALASERPLLLNPFKEDPGKHLQFVGPEGGDDFGKLKGITLKGKTSVKIYNLNRNDLALDRRRVYYLIKDRLDYASARPDKKGEILSELMTGESDYNIVVKPTVVNWLQERMRHEQAEIEKKKFVINSLDNDLKMLSKSRN